MRHEELFYLLALQKIDGVGDVLSKKLISRFGSAAGVFRAGIRDLESVERLGRAVLKHFRNKDVFLKAEKELEAIEALSLDVRPFNCDTYPDRLKHCPDAPLLLFTSGNIDLSNSRLISIVGTRHATPHGADFTRQLVSDLAVVNPVIVSGFAYGIDIIAHQAAVDCGLQTLAVVGNGLSRVYPAAHKKYVSKINANGGFLSEFWSRTEPERENFVRRNRIVAGMSEATIVVESAERGGSLITANYAVDYNRELFAVPGRTTDHYSIGCNNLIKSQKAHVLTSAADLIYMQNWKLDAQPERAVQKQLFVTLEPDEQYVYDYLVANGRQQLDTISLECGHPVFRLSSMLLNMELKGVVRPLPGKLFEAV